MKHRIDTPSLSISDIIVFAQTLVGEAPDEQARTKLAIACMIRNRLWDDRWPMNIGEICKQFECWAVSSGKTALIESLTLADASFLEALSIAFDLLAGKQIDDITNGATHMEPVSRYYSLRQSPAAGQQRVTAEIGGLVFLR